MPSGEVKIPDLAQLTGLAADDYLPVVDKSADQTKWIRVDELGDVLALLSGATFTGDVEVGGTLTNKRGTPLARLYEDDETDSGIQLSLSGRVLRLQYRLADQGWTLVGGDNVASYDMDAKDLNLTADGGILIKNDPIAEYGSNSNGEFVRFYNGVQICWKTDLTLTSDTTNEYRAAWTHPAGYVGAPVGLGPFVNYGSDDFDASGDREHLTAPGCKNFSSQITARIWVDGGVTTGQEIRNVAIASVGRWK